MINRPVMGCLQCVGIEQAAGARDHRQDGPHHTLPPDVEPRATGHIRQMIRMIGRLVEQGHAYAQGVLGEIYRKGEGVPQDLIYAHMWGSIVASNGDEDGSKLRDLVAKEMTSSQIEKAEQLARECVRKEYKGC